MPTTGVVTLIATGTATIRCALANNTLCLRRHGYYYCIKCLPEYLFYSDISNYENILLGANQTYTANLYTNGILDTDTLPLQ